MKKIILLLTLASTVGAPQAADEVRVWGAIALNLRDGTAGFAVGTERDMVSEQARLACSLVGDIGGFRICSPVAAKNTTFACVAIAFAGAPADSWAAGWGFADSYEHASNKALIDCQRKGINGCQVKKTACPG